MSENRNPWVSELLSWHGHEAGGVRVPFQKGSGNPLKDAKPVDTDVLEKMGSLVENLAAGEECPRWIFLIGGPGNGKSEAIVVFLKSLDKKLSCEGKLKELLRNRYSSATGLTWEVDIQGAEAESLGTQFQEKIGRLVVVQDASVSTEPNQNAAEKLNMYLYDLLTTPEDSQPVFVCCMNRGLLARAIKHASQNEDYKDDLLPVFIELSKATGLTSRAFSDPDTPCWPLRGEHLPGQGRFACWPLDMQSLLLEPEAGGYAPTSLEQMLEEAVDKKEWEVTDRCSDCSSGDVCPFRQNASWLRGPNDHAQNLGLLLRRTELATSHRWTFRTLFSLIAEILVGEWGDFPEGQHPCEWVHEQKRAGNFSSWWNLLGRLYPHALFPKFEETVARSVEITKPDVPPASKEAFEVLTKRVAEPTTAIRRFLLERVANLLDPAKLSEAELDAPMSRLEGAYSQSVHQGNEELDKLAARSAVELKILDALDGAEDEWDQLSVDSDESARAVRVLRVIAATVAKRSAGVRLGLHGEEPMIKAYAEALRNGELLDGLREGIGQFLGEEKFTTDALATLGQPHAETKSKWPVVLRGGVLPVKSILPAPSATAERPAHDLPVAPIRERTFPVTFELFRALKMKERGCLTSSLPASVRAALESIAVLYAGELCRSVEKFSTRETQILLQNYGEITISQDGTTPVFKESRS